jgi:hypothetical protein
MVKAREIVFAPHDGGQAEILQCSDLLFANESDAVAKIHRVLESPSLQSVIRSTLLDRAQFFSTSSFISSVREFVSAAIQAGGRPHEAIGMHPQ